MGDDASHAAHRRQLFGLAQCLFGLQLHGNVADHLKDRVAFVVDAFAAGYHDLGSVPGLLNQVALPAPLLLEGAMDLFSRNRKDGLQENVKVTANCFLTRPTVEILCAGVPKLDAAPCIAHHDRFRRNLEQLRAHAKLHLALSQLLCALDDATLEIEIQRFQHARLAVQFHEDADFGAQHLGHHGHGDVIHCSAAIALDAI